MSTATEQILYRLACVDREYAHRLRAKVEQLERLAYNKHQEYMRAVPYSEQETELYAEWTAFECQIMGILEAAKIYTAMRKDD